MNTYYMIIGMVAGFSITIIAIYVGMEVERNKTPKPKEKSKPVCHYCGCRLEPVLAFRIQIEGSDKFTPPDAEWMCTQHKGVLYFKSSPSIEPGKPAPITEL